MLKIDTYQSEAFPNLVERLWFLENTGEPIKMMVPPCQYVNLVFPIGASVYKRNNQYITQTQVEGVHLETQGYVYPAGTRLLGIRFYAYGLYPFFQLEGENLLNNSIPLQNNKSFSPASVVKQVDSWLSSIFTENSFQSIIPLMEFYKHYRWNCEVDSIEEFCRENDTNYTSLNRKFTKVIGVSPKKFERLLKFRKALCSLIDSSNNLTNIGADSGDFDQAHFIREFKLFLDLTPTECKSILKKADKESKIINYNFRLF